MKNTARFIAMNLLPALTAVAATEDAITPGEFIVEPATLICAGFEWKVSGDQNRNASVEVKYRKQGGASWQTESPAFTLRPEGQKAYRSLREFFAGAGQEQHGRLVDYDIFERVTAPDPARPEAVYLPGDFDFQLRPGSAAVDAGCVLPNVNDGFSGRAPDLGAYEIAQAPVVYGPRPKGELATAQGTGAPWKEKNGVISMEAEKGTGAFAAKSDPETSGGKYIHDEGAGPKCDENYIQSFTFSTVTPGKWFVFLRARKGSTTPATDDENDVCMLVDGAQLYGADNVTRPVGMRVGPMAWTWTFVPKGPGGHTPDNIRNLNTHALMPTPGVHTLQFRHRSAHMSIDKIVLKHESVPDATVLPTGFGPPETL